MTLLSFLEGSKRNSLMEDGGKEHGIYIFIMEILREISLLIHVSIPLCSYIRKEVEILLIIAESDAMYTQLLNQ